MTSLTDLPGFVFASSVYLSGATQWMPGVVLTTVGRITSSVVNEYSLEIGFGTDPDSQKRLADRLTARLEPLVTNKEVLRLQVVCDATLNTPETTSKENLKRLLVVFTLPPDLLESSGDSFVVVGSSDFVDAAGLVWSRKACPRG